MVNALVLRGHAVHLVVFGIPMAGLVGAILAQEIRARRGSASPHEPLIARSPGLRVAAGGLVAAAGIHAIVIAEHFRESNVFGLFFSVLAATQLGLAVIIARHPDVRIVRYVAVGSAAVVGLWLVSRTSGLPIGPEPWTPEAFGSLDLAATAAELFTLAGCAMQVWTASGHRRPLGPRVSKVAA
jgi:hypothetical protein